ncbi:MAG: hypothetical protein A2787_00750 [Omnitrophica WOR_2 bacterium RIFCSPHIGHO2_01_FULL_48_9]|nr:MAG: hypothetical protein A3D10_07025 [Omnitrophica WOR_2 bacterium RIFCSPHIGHO2_02_FULL_48_11]OGX30706.1 MAG: hypothetical protein A2787_00750 [Omnitrophica WOR_2 bacterium RIFCSPHIGHO2_01_FULL_48_9]
MAFRDFMNRVRQWDNQSAKWMMRHFYLLFFEFVLVMIFLIGFFNTIQFIDFSFDVARDDIVQRLLLTQSVYMLVVVLLMLLNSFWILYIFNYILRMQNVLKDISFSLSRRRDQHAPQSFQKPD